MFTGIVQARGEVRQLERRGGDVRISIGADLGIDWQQVALGDSIATNGVCLTAIALDPAGFSADVSTETLKLTTIGRWQPGTQVNLEQALTPSSRLGGHLVSGHVDGLGEVIGRETRARSEWFTLRAPAELARYIAQKGSITVDGVSLTVNAVQGSEFELNIVPFTLEHTVIGGYRPGTTVNLEVDLVARYLERLLDPSLKTGGGMSEQWLAEQGFGGMGAPRS